MALFKVKTSKKVETQLRLEESTAKMLDRYAHFHKASADEVANEALEYCFTRDKDFPQHLQQNQSADVPASLRIKKVPGAGKGAKVVSTGVARSNGTAAQAASSTTPNSVR